MAFDAAISLNSVVIQWPDGTLALDGLSGSFSAGTTGIVGRNGAGKTTLLRLIAGELRPTVGTATVHGSVTTLPQHLGLDTDRTVADALGIAPILAAIAAIEDGQVDDAHFDTIGDRWDVEAEALGVLDALGLHGDGLLDRRLGTISGGETVLVGLARVQLEGADITLLDEPTNNLDHRAKQRLIDAVANWRGTLLVVSHDRELLERVDRIAEIHGRELRTFDGPYSAYEAAIAREQDAARHAVRDAEQVLRNEKRERIEANEKRQKAMAAGRRAQRAGGIPKIIAGGLKNAAERTTAASRKLHEGRESDARAALEAAELAIRDDRSIAIELPETRIAAGRVAVELARPDGSVITVRGPERIALWGDNGAGKSTLMRAIMAWPQTPEFAPQLQVRHRIAEARMLGQRLDDVDDDASLVDAVRAEAPTASPQDARAQLARFLFRGRRAEQRVRELSGGERLRLVLASVLLAEPAPQLLLLDEPTNSLDLDSLQQLESALNAYEGALIVVSHDQRFLDRIGITHRWGLQGCELVDRIDPSERPW